MTVPVGSPEKFRSAGSLDAQQQIPCLDEHGRLYRAGKLEAHILGLHHLAVSVFLFDDQGRLLVQRRAQTKYHSPGQWANTCCSHPHMGESLAACAARRTTEELGLREPFPFVLHQGRTIDYKADVGGGLIENERVTFFTARVTGKHPVMEPNPAEVAETRWITADMALEEVAKRPETFAPWFRIYMTRFPGFSF